MNKKNITLLSIDEIEKDQQLIQELLNENPHHTYTVLKAYSSTEGFQLYASHAKEIECILLDRHLPNNSGFEVLSSFKSEAPSVPVIILTQQGSYADDLAALENGASDYIIKEQTNPEELERAIRYAMDKQRIINELKAANEEKEHFLRIMSHDMKSPLASILGFTHIMANDKTTPPNEKQQKTLDKIKKLAEYLNKIINDIMTTALIDKGKVQLNCEEFNLIDALSFCMMLVKPKAMYKNISIKLSTDSQEVNVFGDKHKLTEAVENLIENAVKFTSQGSVLIDIKQENEWVVLRIKDTGIGMDQHQVSRIFEPFVQASDSIQKNYGGLGLGLSIAKNFIGLHGGTIEVKSELGIGTEFIVRLPSKRTHCCSSITESASKNSA